MKQQIQTKQLPKGWKEEPLAQCVSDVIMGQSPKGESYNSLKKGLPLLNGAADIKKNQIIPKKYTSDPKKKSQIGDVLVCIRATLGRPVISDREYALGRGIASIRPDEKKVIRDFIYYWAQTIENSLKLKSKGTAIIGITKNDFCSMPFFYPESKEEQSLIVQEIETQFTRLDEAVKSLKSVKEKLELYRKAVLKKAFEKKEGWGDKKIVDTFTINPKKSEVVDFEEDIEVSFIPMAYVSETGKIISMDKRPLREVKKGFTFFKEGDVLLAKITPCFENGKKAIAQDLFNGIGFGTTEFYVFRTKGEILQKWIYYNLSREDFRSGAKRSMGGAVGQQRVSKDFIENFILSFPKKLTEQEKIISSIESKFSVIDKIEQVVETSLEKAEKLRKSILKSAFEGKLVKKEVVEKW